MAPFPESVKSSFTSLLRRTASPQPSPALSLSPKVALLAARAQELVPRSGETVDPSEGVTPFENIPNKAVFALFGLIGVAFVVTGIWFFFWAKNGGFYFRQTDWDDYKSTVLRQKGPNGTTLSGATATTDLGGGSIVHEKRSVWGRKKKGSKRYKDFDDEATTEYTGSAGGSSLGSEMSELKKEKRKNKKEKKSRLRGGELLQNQDQEEEVDSSVQDAMRAYRHEKPARVGGLNKATEGSTWDGSTADNSTVASELMSHREPTPTNTPTKIRKERNDNYTGGNGGIRKVTSTSTPANNNSNSFWNRTSSTTAARHAAEEAEQARIRAEAKKLQEKGRAATASNGGRSSRRDFSFQAGDDTSTVVSSEDAREARRERRRRESRSPTKKQSVPGSYYEESEVGSNISRDSGTKSYHHPIPGLSSGGGNESRGGGGAAAGYADERRKKRAANGGGGGGGGYRRGRRDSLDD